MIVQSSIELVLKGNNMSRYGALGVRKQLPLVGSFISEEATDHLHPPNEYSLHNRNWTGRYSRLTAQPEQVRALTMIFHNYALFRTI